MTGAPPVRRRWRIPLHARTAALLLAVAVLGCHSIDEDGFAVTPVPLETLPLRDPLTYTVGTRAGQLVTEQNGLLASYFNGANYADARHGEILDHQQIDTNINFVWEASGANPVVEQGGIDHADGDPRLPDSWPIWSIVWEGFLETTADGTYGLRLHVNNGGWLEMLDAAGALRTVLDCHGDSSTEPECTSTVDLTTGRHYIRVSYFNNAPPVANAIFSWMRPGDTDFSVVPTEALFTQAGPVGNAAPKLEVPPGVAVAAPFCATLVSFPVRVTDVDSTSWSVSIDFGDGLPAERISLTTESPGIDRTTVTPSHVVSCVQQQYIVTTTVTDGEGASDVKTTSVVVLMSPPVAVTVGKGFGTDTKFGWLYGEPVNSANGNLALGATDLSLPSRGLSLELARTYNSRDPRTGVFGPGWSSVLDVRVATFPDGTAVVLRPDGRRDSYTKRADGTYAQPDGVFDELRRNPDQSWTLLTVDQRRLDFTRFGILRLETDRNGNTRAYELDTRGRVTRLVGAGGRAIAFTYDADDRLIRAADSAGRSTTYTYVDSRLASATDPAGGVTHYTYDGSGRLVTVVDARGTTVLRNAYDAAGRVTGQVDGAGAAAHFSYDDASRTTTITNPRGARSRLAHDELGRVLSATDPNGRTETYSYDARGNQIALRDRAGNAWQFAYDERGNRTAVVDPAGGRARFTYDTRNRMLTRTDPLGNTWAYTYDDRGNLVAARDPEDGVTRLELDGFGQLTAETDADGVRTAFEYDSTGDLVARTTAAGTMRFTQDGAGRLVRRTDESGAVTELATDAVGRVTSLTDPAGSRASLAYDAVGNLVRLTDRAGATRAYSYDGRSRLLEATDPLGARLAYAYDADGNMISFTDATGGRSTFAYDSLDRLATATDALGVSRTFTYDANGNTGTATDGRGGVTAFVHDFRNRMVTTTDPTGSRNQLTYDGAGRLVRSTDAAGAATSFAYDRAGRYVSTTDPIGATYAIAYTSAGRPASVTDPLGGVTRFEYDATGRLAAATDPLGGRIRYAYDAVGNLVERTDQAGARTRFSYDGLARVVAMTDALGGVTALAYDAEGRITSLVDPNGNATRFAYDGAGRLTVATDALGNATRYGYDARGLVVALADANGHTRRYEYDAQGQLVAEIDALERAKRFAYDPSGNLASAVDAKGQRTTYSYDAADRLTRIAYADGTTVGLTRDVVGRVVRMDDALGTTTLAYDAAGRLVDATDAFGARTRYGYDAIGRRTGLTYPAGRAASFAYDANGRLTAVDAGTGPSRFTFDAVGNEIAARLANGASESATYDALGRLVRRLVTDANGSIAADFSYVYDPVGNVASARERGARNLAADLTYQYDARNRLVGVTRDGKTTTYGYDAVGNRTRVSGQGSESLTASYDAADELVKTVRDAGGKTTTFGYDPNGSLVERTTPGDRRTYAYDAAGRLVWASDQSTRISYRYDGLGRLMQEERAMSGNARRTLRYALDQAAALAPVLAATDGASTADYVYASARVAAFSGADARYFAADVVGSPRVMLDARGQVTGVRGFDAFGVPDSDASAANEDGPFGLAELFGFGGERQDRSTGLANMGARFYDPGLERFLSADPLPGVVGLAGTHERYTYAQANPLRLADPSGLSTWPIQDKQPAWTFYTGGAPCVQAPPLGGTLSMSCRVPQLGTGGLSFAKDPPQDVDWWIKQLPSEAGGESTVPTPPNSGPGGGLKDLFKAVRDAMQRAGRSVASAGYAISTNYRETFFEVYPELRGKVQVHHAIEQDVLNIYPGVMTREEIHSLENLRGIPIEIAGDVHQGLIRRLWNAFYKSHRTATKQELLDMATLIDYLLGSKFLPPR